MTARTRKWVVLSALCLLSLDLALVAVAAPRARGWFEGARTSALARAGAIAFRQLEGPLARRVAGPDVGMLARLTRGGDRTYAYVLRVAPPAAARAATVRAHQHARWVMVEARCVRAIAAGAATVGPMPAVPALDGADSCCPESSGPEDASPRSTASGSSATGLPATMLGMTLE